MTDLRTKAKTKKLDSSTPKYAIVVDKLRKEYPLANKNNQSKSKKLIALDDLSLKIPTGSIFGLLGPNGAGKSTFINILAGLTIKTSGTALIWDIDIDKDARNARACLGVTPQEMNLDPFFKPFELLEIIAGLYGVKKKDRKTKELLSQLKLEKQAFSYSRTLSGGMKRRLMIAKALVHQPPIIILDEPTAGVDIELRKQLWTLIKELNDNGVTIILTTHYLEEAEFLCDRIAIINHGSLVIEQDKKSLVSLFDTKTLTLSVNKASESLPNILKSCNILKSDSKTLQIQFSPSKITTGEIIAACIHHDIKINDISITESDLEDVFLKLVAEVK